MQPLAKEELFNSLAHMLYNNVEDQRIHSFYRECLQASTVPRLTTVATSNNDTRDAAQSGCGASAASVYAVSDQDVFGTPMELYRRLIESVPTEAATVPVILHCMLEQVSVMICVIVCVAHASPLLTPRSTAHALACVHIHAPAHIVTCER